MLCVSSVRFYLLAVAFGMYDMNGNGFITRDELLVILNMMVGPNITPDQVRLQSASEIARSALTA